MRKRNRPSEPVPKLGHAAAPADVSHLHLAVMCVLHAQNLGWCLCQLMRLIKSITCGFLILTLAICLVSDLIRCVVLCLDVILMIWTILGEQIITAKILLTIWPQIKCCLHNIDVVLPFGDLHITLTHSPLSVSLSASLTFSSSVWSLAGVDVWQVLHLVCSPAFL